jgi:hypothetical protein
MKKLKPQRKLWKQPAKTRVARQSATQPKRKTSHAPFILGRKAFAKISAVEGISLTEEMQRDFARFDREKLSAAERRRALARKYARSSF